MAGFQQRSEGATVAPPAPCPLPSFFLLIFINLTGERGLGWL